MLALSWQIGKTILEQQQTNWGNKIAERLAEDMKQEFPEAMIH